VFVAFAAVTHAELETEVDAQADEQDRKGHRDEIERSHHHEPERRRDRQADRQIDEDRNDDPVGLERKPQDEQHDRDRDRGIECGAFLEGAELFVSDRYRPGQPDTGAEFAGEIEVGDGLADRRGRPLARLERAIIQHRLDGDDPAQLRDRRRLSVHQDIPGEPGGLARQRFVDRIGRHGERPRKTVERDLLPLHARQGERQRLHQSAQTRVAGQLTEQRSGLR